MIKTSLTCFARRLQTGLLVALMAVPSLPVTAATPVVPAASGISGPGQPSWICNQLEDAQYYSDESYIFIRRGKGDWLFRSHTDFNVYPPVAGSLVNNFAHLNKVLKASNVRLAVLVTPPRGSMMREFIDPAARNTERYSPDIAMQSYQKTLSRLRSTGIFVPDVTAAALDNNLSLPGTNSQFYLSGDIHWTAYGAYVTANATARELARHPEYRNIPKTEFKTALGAVREEQQMLRLEASRICHSTYKADKIRAFETVRAAAGAGGNLLDGGDVEIALVGTSFSVRPTANFSGFLRQELRADVANYAIGGGGFEASILSYLLSADYQAAKPKVLIWEMQYHNLDGVASFPLILGAADGDCGNKALVAGKAMPVKHGKIPIMALSTAQRSKIRGPVNVVVNLTSPDARQYRLTATYTDGRQDQFDIDASRWPHPANKMIMRLPRDGGELADVSLIPHQRLSGTAAAHVCRASS
ncbi:alginate biosynthesis protein algX [Asticcacaulis biprosthecium C19]|uniref:Alginate biosynthesis protein algX n=1 Tax=Asticcacaulis biprosthecium C19 TaxID=715226 RepID=F4QTK4_9CAUL|nr:alginate biosynthesis protein algX [Asticcacaulis biprosthecium]EGF90074.1 alginate biosynthesis protein algX [Asticcacaulis biprosthecium C19]